MGINLESNQTDRELANDFNVVGRTAPPPDAGNGL
jgi:hypothetical protein